MIFILISDLQQPIQWPSLVACKVPLFKNEEKYKEFLMKVQNNDFKDEQEFNDLSNSSLYKEPEDFFVGISIGGSYDDGKSNTGKQYISSKYTTK